LAAVHCVAFASAAAPKQGGGVARTAVRCRFVVLWGDRLLLTDL